MQYFWLTIKHKWFVFLAGLRTGAPLWRLIIHDWSKFTWLELPHYQRQFFGKANQPLNFAKAWCHHQNLNPHHWEYWIPRTCHNKGENDIGPNQPLPMPDWAIREMIADWIGASRTYEGKYPDKHNWQWLNKNWNKIRLHKNTRRIVRNYLFRLGYMVHKNHNEIKND